MYDGGFSEGPTSIITWIFPVSICSARTPGALCLRRPSEKQTWRNCTYHIALYRPKSNGQWVTHIPVHLAEEVRRLSKTGHEPGWAQEADRIFGLQLRHSITQPSVFSTRNGNKISKRLRVQLASRAQQYRRSPSLVPIQHGGRFLLQVRPGLQHRERSQHAWPVSKMAKVLRNPDFAFKTACAGRIDCWEVDGRSLSQSNFFFRSRWLSSPISDPSNGDLFSFTPRIKDNTRLLDKVLVR